jgi:hypothetical protein
MEVVQQASNLLSQTTSYTIVEINSANVRRHRTQSQNYVMHFDLIVFQKLKKYLGKLKLKSAPLRLTFFLIVFRDTRYRNGRG